MEDLTVTVREVVRETDDACSFVLDLPDWFRYRPGQHLTLQVGTAARSYSFSSSPDVDEAPRITVKRTRGGFASNWLCDHVSAGTSLHCLGPAGSFTPKSLDSDLLLFAGGSGITPILSIAKSLLFGGTGEVALIYVNQDQDSVIFATELDDLAEQFPERLIVTHWLDSYRGVPTHQDLAILATPWRARDVFICGPAAFMDATHDALRSLGIPRNRVHIERFQSLSYDPFGTVVTAPAEPGTNARSSSATAAVELDDETVEFDWPPDARLLDQMLANGLDAPYSCREGECGTCMYQLLEGEVTMLENEVLDDEEIDEGYRLACQSLPVSDSIRAIFL